MSFLRRLVSKINGNYPVHDQNLLGSESDGQADDKVKDPSASNVSQVKPDVPCELAPIMSASEADIETNDESDNRDGDMDCGSKEITSVSREDSLRDDRGGASSEASAQEARQSGSVEPAFDEKKLYSDSPSVQRYTWHQYLASKLTKIENVDINKLRNFSIYIRKTAGCNYQWNDHAFQKELLIALEPYDCASHIGSSSFYIEVVSDSMFRQISEKSVGELQFKLEDRDILFFSSKKETIEQKFTTAIDKRAFVINELLKKFRSSTGTDTKLMENLVIIVIRNEEDDDMAKYDWIGKRFEDDLKRELTNAFLEKIGSKSLQIILKPKSETEDCISLIDNQVYYKWGKADTSVDDKSKEIPYERVVASVSIIEGTGSMMQPSYVLDSDRKKIFHIGRGVTSRKGGKYRVNDIVIKDKEADHDLLECNAHVSSTHADIVFKNNKFYIKAAIGGCRAIGGSPTKLVRDEKATELRDTNLLYPLEDGDIIELGKNVLLVYSLKDDSSLPMNFEKERPNNAMSIDDSF